jgi:transposase InsO family protein
MGTSDKKRPPVEDLLDDPDDDHPSVAAEYLSSSSHVLHAEHRRTFNLAAFGTTFEAGAPSPKVRPVTNRMMAKHDYDFTVSVIRHWNSKQGHVDSQSGRLVTQEEFRRSHSKKWYRLGKLYKVTTSEAADGLAMEQLKRYDGKSGDFKLVAHEENTFDAIHECHLTVGHKKKSSTRYEAAQKYYNLTEELCKTFVTCCPECCHEAPKVKKLSGAKNPIASAHFRDRFQADLIDYRSNPKMDVNGVEMKWLLVLKDHFTKFTMVRPIARKEAKLVAHELAFMFGVLGYPLVFHTDNGGEFTAETVMTLIRDWNPSCTTVTGRRRMPSDQGSVERANASVKAVIAKLEQYERNKGNQDPNWVLLSARAMSAVNCSRVDG